LPPPDYVKGESKKESERENVWCPVSRHTSRRGAMQKALSPVGVRKWYYTEFLMVIDKISCNAKIDVLNLNVYTCIQYLV
jgi:hypothetical protein